MNSKTIELIYCFDKAFVTTADLFGRRGVYYRSVNQEPETKRKNKL